MSSLANVMGRTRRSANHCLFALYGLTALDEETRSQKVLCAAPAALYKLRDDTSGRDEQQPHSFTRFAVEKQQNRVFRFFASLDHGPIVPDRLPARQDFFLFYAKIVINPPGQQFGLRWFPPEPNQQYLQKSFFELTDCDVVRRINIRLLTEPRESYLFFPVLFNRAIDIQKKKD